MGFTSHFMPHCNAFCYFANISEDIKIGQQLVIINIIAIVCDIEWMNWK